MENVTNVSIVYEPSDSIEMQGKYEKIQKYKKQGYYIKEERNGYWVLVKSARVLVTLTNSNCAKTFSMKEDILEYYGRKRISEKLLDKFRADVDSGKIIFKMNEDGTKYSMK